MYQDHLVTDNNGLLPHPITYAQVDPLELPATAQSLRDAGYHEVKVRWEFTKMWFLIPIVKTGVSTLWVRCRKDAETLIVYWSRDAWKYSINWAQQVGILPY
jgi:hypothetical protein